MKRFKVGDLVVDILGNILKVVETDEMWTWMKWVRKDGSLSDGCLGLLPSQLAGYEELNVEGEENER